MNDPDRVTAPMIRRSGELVEVGWPEAIEHVGDSLLEIARREGPESIAVVAGNELSVEDGYAVRAPGRGALGTANVYQAESGFARTADVIEAHLGSSALFPDQDAVLESDFALVFGADVNGTHNVLAAHMKAAARKGQMTYATATRVGSGLDVFASSSLRLKPGDEISFLGALANPTAEAASELGNEAGELAAIAEKIAGAERAFLIWDTGAWTRGREAEIAAAACRLASATGAALCPLPETANAAGIWQAGVGPELLPGRDPADDPHSQSSLGTAWNSPPTGRGRDFAEFCSSGELTALYWPESRTPASSRAGPRTPPCSTTSGC